MKHMTKTKIAGAATGLALLSLAGGSLAAASGGSGAAGSRLDDGKQYASQAKTSEHDAIAAAQTKASGGLNEVDLEQANGRLVYNVDVGANDVKVDASTGQVVAVDQDN